MSTTAYKQVVETPARDRLDLFLATANRLGAPVGNIEKDFWVCWTLNALYHERPAGAPRLLFKGGTSLSKAYGLIQRFSEDIDIAVFRDDLDEPASVEELEALSNKKRRARLDAIRDACRAYITGPLRELLAEQLADLTGGVGASRSTRPIPTDRHFSSGIQRLSRATAHMCAQPFESNPAQSQRLIRIGPSRSAPTSPTRRHHWIWQ